MKRKYLNIGIIIILLLSLMYFYKINYTNYIRHIEIKQNLVEHPENLPEKETALKTSFWFKNLRADIYRLETIQYIWSNVIWAEYKKYLYVILDLITELNPYFEHPYIIWTLLLPDYNARYEDLSDNEIDKNISEWEEIALKWIKNFCDEEKIEIIANEEDLTKIWTDEKYEDPCKSFSIPYYLAYLYYFNKHNPINASKYYKIASANKDAPDWVKVMAAIMQWKWGNREKSFFMFLNLAKFIDNTDETCNKLAGELETLWNWIFLQNNITLDERIVETVEKTRNKVFWEFNEEDEEKILWNTNCINYVNKAIRELNLAYIEQANEIFKSEHNWAPALNAQWLYNDWYIKFLPTDFQQYDDYWIIYEYNKETWYYDYNMGTY